MTRYAKPGSFRSVSYRTLCAAAAVALVLSGCASKVMKPAAAPTAAPAAPLVDKGNPDTRFKAALALMKNKQSKEAKDAFTELAKDFPEFSGPLSDLGILQSQSKLRAPAIANFEKAVKANPGNAIAHNWLGTLYRENGDYALAEAAYRKAVTSQASYPAPHLNLGILYDAYLRRPQAALTEYREYQRLAGTDKLIVSAWIRDLETSAPTAAPATAPTEIKR